jgi:hypothetical protein
MTQSSSLPPPSVPTDATPPPQPGADTDALDSLFLETDTSTGSLLDELGLSEQALEAPETDALTELFQTRHSPAMEAVGDAKQLPLCKTEGAEPLVASAIGHALMAKLSALNKQVSASANQSASWSSPLTSSPPLNSPPTAALMDNEPHFHDNDTIVTIGLSNPSSVSPSLPGMANGTFGGNTTAMEDFSAYRDLSHSPSDDQSASSEQQPSYGGGSTATLQHPLVGTAAAASPRPTFSGTPNPQTPAAPAIETEFNGNVQTLIRLVNDLPEGVTKQTGAQIIRLTMEAMGISMEEVLSEAQSAQTDMLDAVRSNIRKIEELKAVQRKLDSDNKLYQGKANTLSEMIDLFVLSSPSPSRIKSAVDELSSAPAYPASGF